MNILIAEDDPDMQKILALYLKKEGYDVDTVSDGQAAVQYLAKHGADLVLLDWMMPVQDGIETCRQIRDLNIPVKILMLTAKGENKNEITGLSCGADDYMRKPFDIQILLLRIKKLCNLEGVLRFRDISLNQNTFEAKKGDSPLVLTRIEFGLLCFFLRNQRMILTREQLLNNIWGMDFEGDIRTVDTHIRRLRKKIGEDYIRTRIGIGYVMGEQNG
jgi:two-component system alkaline phosphatase synthesis response regulator PhoP